MIALIDQAIRLSVVLTSVLIAAFLLRRQSAALRHTVLTAGVLCGLALPMGGWLVPEWSVVPPPSIHVTEASVAAPGARDAVAAHPAPGSLASDASAPGPAAVLGSALLVFWAVGAAAGLLVLVAGVARLAWHERHARVLRNDRWRRAAEHISRELRIRRAVTILETTSASMIGAWGWRHPAVMVPRAAVDWPDEDVEIVLRHELAHVARGDWSIQLAAEILRALHWFNPLASIACARLRLESERACDDEVLGSGVRADDYAARLVRMATALAHDGRQWEAIYPAPGMTRSSTLERRVSAMLDHRLTRTSVSGRVRVAIVALALVLSLPLAGMAVLPQLRDGFSGIVLDQSGKNVANARIVLTQGQTKARHEIRSDDHGRFEFAGLAPGNYDVEASLPGFMTLRGSVTVASGGVTRDLKLELATVQETLTVAGGPSKAAPRARQATPREPREDPPCVPTAMGGDVRPPMKVKHAGPEYPQALQSAKVSGLVAAEGILAGDGTVHDLRIVRTPHPDLARSVIDAIGQWRFTPTLLNCQPADIKIKIDANFVLQ